MTAALSNPYEMTCGGITCKASPYMNGCYISYGDIEKIHLLKRKIFINELFDIYKCEKVFDNKNNLVGIKVGQRKEHQRGKTINKIAQ